MNIGVHVILTLLFLPFCVDAQTSNILPIPFLQFNKNYAFENPAASSYYSAKDVRLVSSNYTGLLKNVGVYYLDASTQYKMASNLHSFGLVVHSEFETDLLKRTRAFFRYSWKTALSKDLDFSGAASFGFFYYLVKSTSSSAGTSSFSVDGSIGVWLKGKNFNTGIALNQVPNAMISPIENGIKLTRYATVIADYLFKPSPDYSLLVATETIFTTYRQRTFQGTVESTLFTHYALGFLYRYHHGAGVTLGLKEFELNKISGDINFAYLKHSLLAPSRIQNFGNDRIEILLRLYIN